MSSPNFPIIFSSTFTPTFIHFDKKFKKFELKQGRIHGKTVADDWAGAIMQYPFGIQQNLLRTDLLTYRPTRQNVELRVRD